MKKTYIIPELEVVMIQTQQQMLAGSTVPTGSTPTDPASSDAHLFEEENFEW